MNSQIAPNLWGVNNAFEFGRFSAGKAGFAVKRALVPAFLISLFGSFCMHSALACRYNVRETGFVDLGAEPYVLCGYVDGNTPADIKTGLRQISDEVLAESNVIVRVIDTDRQKDHPAMKHFDANDVSGPSAVLISPDGQILRVSITQPGQPFEKVFRAALNRILSSPKRLELLLKVSRAYGVVLLIEGPDAAQNEKAKQAALAAIEQVKSQMELMPKPIAHPPELVVMDSNSLADERILLWSIGLEPKDVNEPHAIIIYGRARWIGPLFKGEQITEDDLASVLFVIGADCECGFDYRWLQGTMLPAKWDQKTHERAVESLGFDPESPMIKMEIGSIIGRGMGGYSYPGMPTGGASGAYGYQELIIEPETDAQAPRAPGGDPQAPPADKPDEEPAEPAQTMAGEPNVVETVLMEQHEPNAARTEIQKIPGPYETASAHGRRAPTKGPRGLAEPNMAPAILETAKPAHRPPGPLAGNPPIRGTYATIRGAAFLVVGVFALVIILGVAILARSRRA
jgi:hypothetical protein